MLFLTLSLALYFVPALLASSRNHPRSQAIWVVNVLVGWTVVGWVVCLVWALSEPRLPMPTMPRQRYPAAYAAPYGQTINGQYGTPDYPAGWSAAAVAATDRGCRACGRPVLPAAAFCTMCGANLQ